MKITRKQLRQIIKEELRKAPYKNSIDYDFKDWGPIGEKSGTILLLPPDPDEPV